MRPIPLLASSLALAFVAGTAFGQGPQAVELASRGPHFIAAWVEGGAPVDVSIVSVFRRRVSLNLQGVTVDDALKEIIRQANLEISYTRTVLPKGKLVSLNARDITVVAALTEVLLDAGLDVALGRMGHLALVKRPEPERVPPIVTDSGIVIGRVTDKTSGSPLIGATVTVSGMELSATTDAEGQYAIRNVPAGVYKISAKYIGYSAVTASVTVHAKEKVTADLELERSAQKLDELVTVTPGGIQTEVRAVPSPVSVITAGEIEAQRPQTINDVVRQAVPSAVGFDIPMQPSATAVTMRGATAVAAGGESAKILVDGIEATNFLSSPVDPASIERVEVIRGPQAATIYGPDAGGGVIQIFTKRGDPQQVRPTVTVGAEAGVLQTPYPGFKGVVRQSYSAELRGGTADATYNLGGSWWRLGNWLDEGAPTSSQSVPSVFGGLRFARGFIDLDLSGRYQATNNWANLNPLLHESGFVALSRPSFLKQERVNQTVGVRMGVRPTGWWRNHLTLGVDRQSVDQVQTRPRLTTPDDTLLNVTTSTQSKAFFSYNSAVRWTPAPTLSAALTAGIDHYRQPATTSVTSGALNTEGTIGLGPGQTFSVGRTVVTNTGYFGQVELGLRERLFLTVGLRADDHSAVGGDVGTAVFPRVGIAYTSEVGGGLSLKTRLSYGGAMRAPAADASFGTVSPFLIVLANPLLRPVRQRGWDGGLDVVFGSRGSFSITAYDQDAKDLIDFVLVATDPVSTFQNQNVGRVTNRGLELEGTLNLLEGRLLLRGQYAYTFSRLDDLGDNFLGDDRVGDRPRGVPAHTAGGAVTVTPWMRTTLTGGATYVGSFRETDVLALFRCFGGTGPCQPESRDYIVNYPGYVKLNVAITQWLLSRLSAFVSVDNLTNNLAQEGGGFVPVQGRLTSVGLQFRY